MVSGVPPGPTDTFLGLVLTNAEEFGSSQNPEEPGERLWLALSTSPVFDPVVAEEGSNRCTENSPFFTTWDMIIGVDESTVDLLEGETKTLMLDNGAHTGNYRVTNLLSHSNSSDGPSNLSFAITRE